jgi:hypothetical protein
MTISLDLSADAPLLSYSLSGPLRPPKEGEAGGNGERASERATTVADAPPFRIDINPPSVSRPLIGSLSVEDNRADRDGL